jgi:hypothetical protein
VLVHADHAALEDAEDAFDGVGMDDARWYWPTECLRV